MCGKFNFMNKWLDDRSNAVPLKLSYIFNYANFVGGFLEFLEGIQSGRFQVKIKQHNPMPSLNQERGNIGQGQGASHATFIGVERGPIGFHTFANKTPA